MAEKKLAQILREVSAGGASSSQKMRALRAKKAVEKLRSRIRRSTGQLVENRSSSTRRQAGTKADGRTSDRGHLWVGLAAHAEFLGAQTLLGQK